VGITLGSITFDEKHTTVREEHQEVGGRNERRIVIVGMVLGGSSVSAIEAKLDAIVDAASVADYGAALSVRSGRRVYVQREAFTREVLRESLVGSFKLTLAARDPFEESTAVASTDWDIASSGATKAVASNGNVFAKPKITLVAGGAVINPSFSDGTRTIAFSGMVPDGETLAFDAPEGRVTLGNEDVTPYSLGVFPQVAPEGVTLTYEDDESSSHTASVTVAFRDRWW
jgi:hypothetical protein